MVELGEEEGDGVDEGCWGDGGWGEVMYFENKDREEGRSSRAGVGT